MNQTKYDNMTRLLYEPPRCEVEDKLQLEQLLCTSPEPGGIEPIGYEEWNNLP